MRVKASMSLAMVCTSLSAALHTDIERGTSFRRPIAHLKPNLAPAWGTSVAPGVQSSPRLREAVSSEEKRTHPYGKTLRLTRKSKGRPESAEGR